MTGVAQIVELPRRSKNATDLRFDSFFRIFQLNFVCSRGNIPEHSVEFEQRTRILQLFYTMANLDSEALSKDSILLNEWRDFNGHPDENVKRFYTSVFRILI